MADKISPSALVAGLYSHFRRMLYAVINKGTAEEAAAVMGVKTFAVENAKRQAAVYGARRIKSINDRINETELNIKSGKIYEYNALILIIMFILSQRDIATRQKYGV